MKLSVNEQRHVILEEIARWERGLYLLEVRARVLRRLGDSDEQVAAIVEEMTRQELVLEEFRQELAGLAE